MKRIILHIGIPKTGSTALQFFLRDCLKDNEEYKKLNAGYYVPTRCYVPWNGPANAGFILVDALNKLGEPKDKTKREFLLSNPSLDIVRISIDQELLRCLEKEKELFKEYIKDYDTIILSEEVIWHYSPLYSDFWTTIKDILLELCGSDITIDIIVYLRRQDRWILTKWKEDMTNQIPDPWDFDDTLEEYKKVGYLDYYSEMLKIEEVFGKEHLIIRNYERKYLENNDICFDFFSTCGFDASKIINNKKAIQRNASSSIEAAYAMNVINKKQFKRNRYHWRGFLYLASKSGLGNNAKDIQTKEEKEALLSIYKEGNDAISQRYFGGKEFFDNNVEASNILKKDERRDKKYAVLLIIKSIIIFLQLIIRNMKKSLMNIFFRSK